MTETIDQKQEETLPQKIFRLKDLCQKYHNMLTCIHDLTAAEREQIISWKTQNEEELKTLIEKQG